MATTTNSPNFEKVKYYYITGMWSKTKVYNMVTNPKSKPWITKAEYKEITGEAYK